MHACTHAHTHTHDDIDDFDRCCLDFLGCTWINIFLRFRTIFSFLGISLLIQINYEEVLVCCRYVDFIHYTSAEHGLKFSTCFKRNALLAKPLTSK